MLEAQLGAFTRLVGPGRPDWRRISFASFLATSQDAARDEHYFLGPASLTATWAHFKHALDLLHPASTTSVTVVAPRRWQDYLRSAAGQSAFPAEGPGNHHRFRLRRRHHSLEHRFDVWHFTLAPPLAVTQQSLMAMRRDERHESHARLSSGRQGEVFDGGHLGLDSRLLRRVNDPRERVYPMPGSAPVANVPRQMAAGDPYRLSSPIPPAGSPPVSYGLRLDDLALRHGRVKAGMMRLPADLRPLKKRLNQRLAAWDKQRNLHWHQLWDIDPTSEEPNPIPRGQDLRVRRYYDCPKATARAHPSVTWHLDDVTADAHARRCQVLSWTNVAAAASALAARAGTAARRAVTAAVATAEAVLGATLKDSPPLKEYTVRDCLDECPRPHAPLDPFIMEELHRHHCPLCRRAEWSATGSGGIRPPGGIRHNARCYFHRWYLTLVYGLWYPWDAVGTSICGGTGGTPVPDAQRKEPQPYWHKSVTEHPEAAAAGLAKWDVVPYATRPVFDAATLRPLGGFVGTYVPGYDLAVHPVRGPDGNLQPPRTLMIKVTFKARDEWMHRVKAMPRKPRVVSTLNFNHNDFCRRASFAYSGTDWVCERLRPHQEGAVDDLSSAFPHLPLALDRRETQAYCDPVTGQWRALVNYGFGSRLSPYYCSSYSGELVTGIKGEAARCATRWERLVLTAPATPAVPNPTAITARELDAPYLVEWVVAGGDINAYMDDLMNLAMKGPHGESICGYVQAHTKRRARLLRWAISEAKSCPPSTTFTYLGLEYCTVVLVDGLGTRAEVRMIFTRREQTVFILDYILQRGRVSRADMDSLIGQIEWVARIMRGGRSHLARLLAFRRQCKQDSRQARRRRAWDCEYSLDNRARLKFQWFRDMIHPDSSWSGTRLLQLASTDYLLWYSDAAGELGWGTYLVPPTATPPPDVVMFQAPWTKAQAPWPSFAKEMHPLLVVLRESFRLKGPNCQVVFTTDSSSTVMAINANRTKYEPAFDMMEVISDLERRFKIDLIARWSDRGRNIVADELSRQRTMSTAWAAHCVVHGGDPALVDGMDALGLRDVILIHDACRRAAQAARRLTRWAHRRLLRLRLRARCAGHLARWARQRLLDRRRAAAATAAAAAAWAHVAARAAAGAVGFVAWQERRLREGAMPALIPRRPPSTARPDSRPRPAPRRHSPDPQGLVGPGHAPAARIQRWWRRHPPPGAYLPPGTYRMADLFAGVLGFSHGVELCNADQDRRVRTVLSFEGCPAACRTSRANRHGRHHRVCRRTLSEDSVGPISAALRRAGVDFLVGSPPCQDHFNGRGLNAKGPPSPPSARATAGILMAKIAIAGGVPAVAFENAPGYVRSPAWAAIRALLEGAGFEVCSMDHVEAAFLPGAAAQSRVRFIGIATRGPAPDIAAAYAAARQPSRSVRAAYGGDWHHHHPFAAKDQAVRSSDGPAGSQRSNCCEPVGFDEAANYKPKGWEAGRNVRVFTPLETAGLQGFGPERVWPAYAYYCPCGFCHRAGSRYNMRAMGRQIGNAVPACLGRFVGNVLLPLLPAPRAASRGTSA